MAQAPLIPAPMTSFCCSTGERGTAALASNSRHTHSAKSKLDPLLLTLQFLRLVPHCRPMRPRLPVAVWGFVPGTHLNTISHIHTSLRSGLLREP